MGKRFAAVVLTLLVSAGAQAAVIEPVYRLAGSWLVGGMSTNGKSAPAASTNPTVYSGLTAAAAIFGGDPTDYAISTEPLSFTPGDLVYIYSDGTYTIDGNFQKNDKGSLAHYTVNMMAYLDGFRDATFLSKPQPENFFSDPPPDGYSNNTPTQPATAAYSAWVFDHTNSVVGQDARNYAFVPVPEPQTWTMMLSGAVLLGLLRSARKTSSRV